MTIALNPNQQTILEHAAQNSGGKIAWFPEHIKGGARAKVLEGLFKRALITPYGDEWIVATEGYDALGLPRPGVLAATNAMDDPALEADVASAEASWQTSAKDKPVRTRADSKQAQLIGMLKAPKGASIDEIIAAFGWQPHTVRGAISGMLRKKLGLKVVLAHNDTGERVYRVV